MTIEEAHIELEITVDKRSTSTAPELSDEVKDYFINEATARFVQTRYDKNNIYQAGFEEKQKRTDDLSTLVKRDQGLLQLDFDDTTRRYIETTYGQTDYILEDIYWFFLRLQVRVVKEGCSSEWVKTTYVQQDDINVVEDDPFNKTVSNSPNFYFENGRIYVTENDDFEAHEFRLTYLKQHAQVNVGTYGKPKVEFDMPVQTHKKIIQIAADIILENIESGRINSIKAQLGTIE